VQREDVVSKAVGSLVPLDGWWCCTTVRDDGFDRASRDVQCASDRTGAVPRFT
jgi:hypothetical protein